MSSEDEQAPTGRRPLVTVAILLGLLGALVAAVAIGASLAGHSTPAADGTPLASNPQLDPGTPLSRPAPEFTLNDQFGRRTSLSRYRGKVVIVAFNDSECTTVCPLTTTAMVDAKRLLGAAGANVALLGIDANPQATSTRDVLAYSRAHGMLHQWRFLTGPPAQLKRVWAAYGIDVQIEAGQIDHTPALYVIDPQGRLRRLYMTQMSYASVPQLGQLLAQEASDLLPAHPQVHSSLSYAQVPSIGPRAATDVPLAGGGSAHLGPGQPRLLLFFATWDRQDLPDLPTRLQALDRYQTGHVKAGLPALTAVDEGSVEPSAGALTSFLHALPGPLSYPVAIDRSGRLADGYEVQDQPWLVLVSASGKIVWWDDVATQGWLSHRSLVAHVRAALSHAPVVKVPTAAGAANSLSGSPAPLAALHAQASQLLGSASALLARVRALRGYPVVVNAWASWCVPCQEEFSLFASASQSYGRQVAFVGADTDDEPGNARAFLAKHPVSYPSYQDAEYQLSPLAQVGSLPTTIFIDRAGKVVNVHIGQYDVQGTLDADIRSYALGG